MVVQIVKLIKRVLRMMKDVLRVLLIPLSYVGG